MSSRGIIPQAKIRTIKMTFIIIFGGYFNTPPPQKKKLIRYEELQTMNLMNGGIVSDTYKKAQLFV